MGACGDYLDGEVHGVFDATGTAAAHAFGIADAFEFPADRGAVHLLEALYNLAHKLVGSRFRGARHLGSAAVELAERDDGARDGPTGLGMGAHAAAEALGETVAGLEVGSHLVCERACHRLRAVELALGAQRYGLGGEFFFAGEDIGGGHGGSFPNGTSRPRTRLRLVIGDARCLQKEAAMPLGANVSEMHDSTRSSTHGRASVASL